MRLPSRWSGRSRLVLTTLAACALLGQVLLASPAAAGEVTNVVMVSLTAPAQVVVGMPFQVTAVVRNDGPGTLGPGGHEPGAGRGAEQHPWARRCSCGATGPSSSTGTRR